MREKKVKEIFDDRSIRYDIANAVISLGLEYIWRRRFLGEIDMSSEAILDVCCGSGISAAQIARRVKKASVYGTDFSAEMIKVARHKYRDSRNLHFSVGNAVSLDFKDNMFDCATVVFGIRNVIDRKGSLEELHRVSKKGGKIVILEFNNVKSGLFGHMCRYYIRKVMPLLGGMITGNRPAYRYLATTISEFPGPERFKALMESSGWRSVAYKPLTGGICNLFVGNKE